MEDMGFMFQCPYGGEIDDKVKNIIQLRKENRALIETVCFDRLSKMNGRISI